MRLRRGTRKQYVDAPIIDGDDEEPIRAIKRHSDDEDFEAEANADLNQEDDKDDEQNDAISDGDDNVVQDGEAREEAGRSGKKQQPQQQQRNIVGGTSQVRKGFHDIPNYPLESRIVTRIYTGPLRRYARYSALRDCMYGPEYERIKMIWDLENRWADFPSLPPKFPPRHASGILPSPWLPAKFELMQRERASRWYRDYKANYSELQRSHTLPAETGMPLIPGWNEGDLVCRLGPCGKQKDFTLKQGSSMLLTSADLPVDDADAKDTEPSGWMVNVGGIPLAIAWAPLSSRDTQILAVASIPSADQVAGGNSGDGDSKSTGCIQFWEFVGERREQGGLACPSRRAPRLLVAKYFSWGRPKRLQWCPVPMDSVSDEYGLLAVICGDGMARVLDVNKVPNTSDIHYEWIESAGVTLGMENEYKVEATCLTWVNTNRIALGHSDGSITLWSIYPRRLLQRLSVHTNYVIDICSAYPSHPYLIASVPVGGCTTLTDFSQPSSELTFSSVPALNFQPNLLCWNETMQGFLAVYPSSTPNTTIAFLHHRFFCQARSICTGPNTLTCVSAGFSHPFVLVGCADGSMFSCNAMQKLFKQKGEPFRKLRIFEHEYRPLDKGTVKGAARILHGFLPEANADPRSEVRKEIDKRKKAEQKKKTTASGKKKGRPKKKVAGQEEEEEEEEEEIKDPSELLSSRQITHEPFTRFTTVQWNPNLYFSCWAAFAMASGIIKVMDLGVQ
ncbi:hypothetical protein QBC46DRAFT_351660 [Diplogelasinospora grovesii]|uniref:Uncharacterized protein n=1 Tax=Diplogelasinospora grovesii TaxID=303347 RepID=A0AAN6NCK1_9PEZI|nr:hypothetical protein QBC46DRAFT_351660 [Diplogelasinospora grovesii]